MDKKTALYDCHVACGGKMVPFASFSTVIAVFENLIASCMDNFGWDRRKTYLIGCVALILLGLPCA